MFKERCHHKLTRYTIAHKTQFSELKKSTFLDSAHCESAVKSFRNLSREPTGIQSL